uniref:Uncharacterized protein n=1 Tax=Avena sativa TaxID=4498 RepID=A0ACD5YP31_AVESA
MAHRPCKKARASSSCAQPASRWPDLPPDMAGDVLDRLPSYADRICFGAVCRSWRSSARQHHSRPLLPCLCFADGTFRGFPAEARPFRLPGAAGHHGSCGEWLVFEREDGAYSLVDPFSQDSAPVALLLPSLSRVRVRHEPIVAAEERDLPECRHPWVPRERDAEPQGTVYLLKLVVCSASLVAAVVGQGRHGKLALCRPGAASTWSVSGREPWRRLKDMAYYHGKLYVVDQNEDLFAVTVSAATSADDEPPTISRLDRVVEGRPPFAVVRRRVTLQYLVESGDGALLMVRREVSRAPGVLWNSGEMDEEITMFEAEFRSSTWKEVKGALGGGGGQALFVGRWGSRAVRVPGERHAEWADRIFFLEDGTGEEWDRRSLRYSLSVYMMKGVDFEWRYLPRRGRADSLLPPMVSTDGDDLPATWIFPQDRTKLPVPPVAP